MPCLYRAQLLPVPANCVFLDAVFNIEMTDRSGYNGKSLGDDLFLPVSVICQFLLSAAFEHLVENDRSHDVIDALF